MEKSLDLNEYLPILTELINRYNGTIQTFNNLQKNQFLKENLKKVLDEIETILGFSLIKVKTYKYKKTLLRAIKAQYQEIPLSWEGSLYSSGRFHIKGQPTLYFAENAETILKEVPNFKNYQYLTFPCEISLSKILDFEKEEHKKLLSGFFKYIRDEWSFFVDIFELKGITHVISDIARKHGIEAIRYESRLDAKYNLAVFPKNLTNGSQLKIIDSQKNQKLNEMTLENLRVFETLIP